MNVGGQVRAYANTCPHQAGPLDEGDFVIFVEVGPRGNLTGFVEDILRGRPHLAVAADTMSRSGITQLNHLVALLAAQGVPMRLDELYARRSPRKLAMDAEARLRAAHPPAAAEAPVPSPMPGLPIPARGGEAVSRPSVGRPAEAEQLMSSYYRTMEQFLDQFAPAPARCVGTSAWW